MKDRILIVEDDQDTISLIAAIAEELGLHADSAQDGETGLAMARTNEYALLVLDLNLPKLGGIEVCRQLRPEQPTLAILMLTSRAEEVDRVLGLELGADDYLCKPFSAKELRARIGAQIRRKNAYQTAAQHPLEDAKLTIGDITVDRSTMLASLSGDTLDLAPMEFELLRYLVEHAGRVVTREELLREVWGYEATGYETTVNSHISRLRQKIEEDPIHPRRLITRRGAGYLLVTAEDEET